MKALVAGATGFIGAHLVRALLSRGHEVIAIVREDSGGLWRLEDIGRDVRIERYSALLELPEGLARQGIGVCFNLASYGVDYRQADPEGLVDGNILVALRLMDLCGKAGIPRFIHVGSGFEYRNTGSRIDEKTVIRPPSLYGSAKAAATLMVLGYAGRIGLAVTVLRPFSVFGPMEGLHRLVPQVMRALIEGRPLRLTPGEQVRDYLFVDDLASAFVSAGEKEHLPRLVYNICADRGISLKSLIETVCRVVGAPFDLFEFGGLPYRHDEIMYYVGDDRRFRTSVDWSPRYSLEEGIRLTYEWYRLNLDSLRRRGN